MSSGKQKVIGFSNYMRICCLTIILIFAFQNVLPCSCSNTNVEKATKTLRNQDAIFQGKVISISPPKEFIYPNEDFLDVQFQVEKSWKGVDSERIVIRSYPKINSCSIDFEVGKIALIVAEGKPLKTDMCIRGNIDSSKFSKIFGAPKVFEDVSKQFEITEGFWSKTWNNLVSFFS